MVGPRAVIPRGFVVRAVLVLAAIGLVACGGGGSGGGGAGDDDLGSGPGAAVGERTLAEIGASLYAANCASCHGAAGEGEPDWRVRRADGTLPAPPHDASGHTWHHSDGLLFRIIRDGCAAYGGDARCRMPAFGDALSDEEIVAVIESLRLWWGPEDRAFQEQVSRGDPFPER